jgi:probable phosphoglycerate mutase
MTELVLLRHGQTDWNREGRIQGQSDSTLDELGHAQARAVAQVMAALSPALLWSSDSVRARETASYVAQASGLEPRYDARLREYHFGPHETLLRDELKAVDPAAHEALVRGNYDAFPGGEDTAEVAARMRAVVAEAFGVMRRPTAATGAAVATGVLVSHGAAIRTVVASLLGWDQHDLRGLDNCGWVVLQEHEPGVHRLRAYNRVVGEI